MVDAAGHISSGHLNPLVTLAEFVRGRIEPLDVATGKNHPDSGFYGLAIGSTSGRRGGRQRDRPPPMARLMLGDTALTETSDPRRLR